MRIIKTLQSKNIASGWLYFYIHFVTEVICFYTLSIQVGDSIFLWAFPLMYDALAFVPQSLVGILSDKYPKIKLGSIGLFFLMLAGLMFWILPGLSPYISLIVLCIGNALVHINGAEVTLRSSNGKLSHSAIFVAGGSFGLITGRVLAGEGVPYWFVIALVFTAFPFSLLAESYREKSDKEKYCPCENFDYVNLKISPSLIVFLAVFIVVVRGYMGYGIPTTWKKTVIQSIIFYFAMGVGKALGGIFADSFGVKKTAIISACSAVPFLLAGNNYMIISIIGVMLFSMTMSITLAMLVSVFKNTPGLAFGWTTIGLFLGTAPIFFFRINTFFANSLIIVLFTAFSVAAMCIVLRKDEKTQYEEH